MAITNNAQSITTEGYTFSIDNTKTPPLVPQSPTQVAGFHLDDQNPNITQNANGNDVYTYDVYDQDEWNAWQADPANVPQPVPVKTVSVVTSTDANGDPYLPAMVNGQEVTYRVSNTSDLRKDGYKIGENEVVFDAESGELLFGDKLAKLFDENRVSFGFDYTKNGFESGELRPEYYFNCTRYMEERDDITYVNFDENGEWITQGIFYNIAGGQQMQINTEAREVFNSDIRRDMDDLIEIVQMAISAQDTVDAIKKKIDTGDYSEAELKNLNAWLDVAQKQLDYANQNMHDTYSAYITKFQDYRDKVDLEITDLGGRGERVSLTKNRMSIQESTFKELKSINEDMDLSELVINYSAASVAYQAALQAAAKIGKMTLLDFI